MQSLNPSMFPIRAVPFARALAKVAAVTSALLLGACSTVMMVDADVRTFATAPGIPATATYRYERLPSQLANPRQSMLEAQADAALGKFGLRRADTPAQYGVQVTEGLSPAYLPPGYGPYGYSSWPGTVWTGSVFAGGRHGGVGVAFPLFPMLPSPWYLHEISITFRDLKTASVVYETRAAHEGPSAHSDAVLPALFEAALSGFPNPPQGARRINIEVPRSP